MKKGYKKREEKMTEGEKATKKVRWREGKQDGWEREVRQKDKGEKMWDK